MIQALFPMMKADIRQWLIFITEPSKTRLGLVIIHVAFHHNIKTFFHVAALTLCQCGCSLENVCLSVI